MLLFSMQIPLIYINTIELFINENVYMCLVTVIFDRRDTELSLSPEESLLGSTPQYRKHCFTDNRFSWYHPGFSPQSFPCLCCHACAFAEMTVLKSSIRLVQL